MTTYRDLAEYRQAVRRIGCPTCGAETMQRCRSLSEPAWQPGQPWGGVEYVHDDRSHAHTEYRDAALHSALRNWKRS